MEETNHPRQMSRGTLTEDKTRRIPLEKYQDIGLLSITAMSSVYKAFDSALNRPVAIKIQRIADSTQAERISREARTIARLNHPNICQVYEAGHCETNEGQIVYFTMQYIDGPTLESASSGLSVEQKALIVGEIAEAVHEANRAGMVHRDIKPANIMLEYKPDGQIHPYLMDFGLVKDSGEIGHSQSGPIGTYYYMAPEQVMGERRMMDRRTDVYGLGATLYDLVCGVPPFGREDSSAGAVLLSTVGKDPLPPRRLNPEAPRELEMIILKCLEKDPNRRYDSALALAEDLQCWLDGEPIQACRSSWTYKSYRKARKHKVITSIIAACTLAVALTFGFLGYSLYRMSKIEDAAIRFGNVTKETETYMQTAYLMPPHDLSKDYDNLKSRLQEIEFQINEYGPSAQGPGYFALGKGYYLIRDYRKSLKYLEKAQFTKYKPNYVNYALLMTQCGIYREEYLSSITPASSPNELRETIFKTIKQLPPSNYTNSLLGYLSGEYEKALSGIVNQSTSINNIDSMILQGDIYFQWAVSSAKKNRIEDALRYLNLGDKTYQTVKDIVRSDPRPYEGLCLLKTELIDMTFYQSPPNIPALMDSLLDNCQQTLKIDPNSSIALTCTAYAHVRKSDYLLQKGDDPFPEIRLASYYAQQAVNIKENALDYLILGFSQQKHSLMLADKGYDPTVVSKQAIASLQRALDFDKGTYRSFILNNTGLCWYSLGVYRYSHEQDPSECFQKAVSFLEKNLSEQSYLMAALGNLAEINYKWALYDSSVDKDPVPRLAIALGYIKEMHQKISPVPRSLLIQSKILFNYLPYRPKTESDHILQEGISSVRSLLGHSPNNSELLKSIAYLECSKIRSGDNSITTIKSAMNCIKVALKVTSGDGDMIELQNYVSSQKKKEK